MPFIFHPIGVKLYFHVFPQNIAFYTVLSFPSKYCFLFLISYLFISYLDKDGGLIPQFLFQMYYFSQKLVLLTHCSSLMLSSVCIPQDTKNI